MPRRPRLHLLTATAWWMLAVSALAQDSGVISGRVYDAETERGLSGVAVRLGGSVRTTTDADGYYWLTGLAEGRIWIECEGAAGYALKTTDILKSVVLKDGAGLDGIDFPLERGVAVSGRLVNHLGVPVSGAEVAARWPGPQIESISKGDGSFVLEGLAPWTEFNIMVAAPGLVADKLQYQVAGSGLVGLVVQLYRAATIRGVLMDKNGLPLREIQVNYGRPGHSLPPVTTDSFGRFELDLLMPGEYVLSTTVGVGREQILFRGPIEEGQLLDNLRLIYDPYAGLSISGRVLDSGGNGLAEVAMAVIGATMQTRATTDEEGYFAAYDLEEGRYELTYLEHGGQLYTTGVRAMAGDENVEIVLTLRPPIVPIVSSGPIHLRVVDASTNHPVMSFEYVLQRGVYDDIDPYWRGPNGEQLVGFYDSIGSSSWDSVHHPEGSVEIPTYATGDHSLALRAKGYAEILIAVVAPDDDLVIHLEPEATVEGVVRTPTGNALPGALIFVGDADWPYPTMAPTRDHRARSDADGSFRVGGLGGPDATLTAWHEDWGSETMTVAVSANQTARADLTLRSVGTLTGYVYLDGQTIRDTLIRVRRIGSEQLEYAGAGDACMDDGDRFVLKRLAPGEVEIIVKLDLYDRQLVPKLEASQIVRIGPGLETAINFVFETPAP